GVNAYNDWMSSNPYEALSSGFRVSHPLSATIMPLVARTGRGMLQLTPYGEEYQPVAWDEGEPWQFRLRINRGEQKCVVTGALHRGEEEMDLSVPVLVTEGGLVFTRDRVAPLEEGTAFEW